MKGIWFGFCFALLCWRVLALLFWTEFRCEVAVFLLRVVIPVLVKNNECLLVLALAGVFLLVLVGRRVTVCKMDNVRGEVRRPRRLAQGALFQPHVVEQRARRTRPLLHRAHRHSLTQTRDTFLFKQLRTTHESVLIKTRQARKLKSLFCQNTKPPTLARSLCLFVCCCWLERNRRIRRAEQKGAKRNQGCKDQGPWLVGCLSCSLFCCF